MTEVRTFLLQHRTLAALVLGAALLMRVLVPSGFMPVVHHGVVAIVPCSGTGPVAVKTHEPAAHGTTHGARHHGGDGTSHDSSPGPCVFSGLAAPALTGADPFLLIAAILFVMVQAIRQPERPSAMRRPRLRPPLRGPPARS